MTEFFVEAGLPLVEDAPWAEELDLNAGYRFSAYDYGKQADTYGIRAGWALNADVRLRGSLQRAIRGPSVREQFLPQGFNLFDMSADPCGGAVTDGRTAAGRTFEECARSGVTRSQFGNIADSPAGQYNFLQGGNPDLSPEDSDTYAYGLIWTPGFVEGFSLSLDYYFDQGQKSHQHRDAGVHPERMPGRQRRAMRQGAARARRRPVAGVRRRQQRPRRVPAGQPGHRGRAGIRRYRRL